MPPTRQKRVLAVATINRHALMGGASQHIARPKGVYKSKIIQSAAYAALFCYGFCSSSSRALKVRGNLDDSWIASP